MRFGITEYNFQGCITITSFSVLINRSPKGFFKSLRGIRQGDPLPPYLFVLGMEVFSIIVDKAAHDGFLTGYMIVNRKGEEVQITHLLFAYNTLVSVMTLRSRLPTSARSYFGLKPSQA